MGMLNFHLPPGLKSCSTTLICAFLGAHHFIIWSGCVQASHTSFTGALKVFLMVSVLLDASLVFFIWVIFFFYFWFVILPGNFQTNRSFRSIPFCIARSIKKQAPGCGS